MSDATAETAPAVAPADLCRSISAGQKVSILGDMPPRPANHEQTIGANLGRETVGAREAFELELGPNNCSVS